MRARQVGQSGTATTPRGLRSGGRVDVPGFIVTNRFLSRLHGICATFRPDMASYGNAIPAMLHAMVRVKPAPMRQPDIFPIDELSGVRASSMP